MADGADYKQALQPITQTSAANQSTKILRELAPQLLHPRILSSPAFLNAASAGAGGNGNSIASSSSSSSSNSTTKELLSLSNPKNAFIALARLRGVPALNLVHHTSNTSGGKNAYKGKGKQAVGSLARSNTSKPTATDIRILEDVDRLLSLPIPSSSSSRAISTTINGLPVVREEDDDDDEDGGRFSGGSDEDAQFGGKVGLLEGFNATMPAARARKDGRRRRRALVSERQLGITAGINELGLKERGDRARGLLSADSAYVVDSIESTPKKRVIRGKRRSSFMPGSAAAASSSSSTPGPRSSLGGTGNNTLAQGLQTPEEAEELMTRPELEVEVKEIDQDKKALAVRRRLVMKDLSTLEKKIKKLESMKEELGQRLLDLKEEELELDDELEGVQDRLAQIDARQAGKQVAGTSSRRRRGPAFLPSEHDQLPPNVAFMTLQSRNPAYNATSVMSLDFSEPYGVLVASYNAQPGQQQSRQQGQLSVYDLTDGEELARLQGHSGIVKALLVEDDIAITGGNDGKIALWDLSKAIEEGIEEDNDAIGHNDGFIGSRTKSFSNNLLEQEEDVFFSSRPNGSVSGRSSHSNDDDDYPPLPSPKPMRAQTPDVSSSRTQLLEGHSKAVTCLSYEDTSLVSGSSDKTLRLWDLNTGQCVVTMDILWAISNPLPADVDGPEEGGADGTANLSKSSTLPAASPAKFSGQDTDFPWQATSSYATPRTKKTSLSGLRRLSSHYGLSNMAGSPLGSPTTPTASMANFTFVQATPPFADGTWDVYSDFVGGLQLWSYALASGSADGCVRMWDTRTGQSVRSLIGHTNAVTTLQFDNFHLVSGSLDKAVRIWDLRTGRTIETIRYDGPVTSLQFDSRRILVAGGSNNVQVFNRTTLQQTELVVNGHTSPVERLRFMDRYLATGARDSTVKIWSLN